MRKGLILRGLLSQLLKVLPHNYYITVLIRESLYISKVYIGGRDLAYKSCAILIYQD